mmetsp:Transcript_18073/g.20910  ORF Transcript_18073/g.20910 Transcript_18073/m.20910 type:complete len:465 (-) Transcript_18073:203-1597(-)
MKRPSGLTIDLSLANSNSNNGIKIIHDDRPIIQHSLMDVTNTYREEGLSIGKDYLRNEGLTMCRNAPEPSNLIILKTIGHGASSVVKLAKDKSRCPKGDDGIGSKESCYYALKIFPLKKEANQSRIVASLKRHSDDQKDDDITTSCFKLKQQRSMLIQELKTLTMLQCDCLIQLQGAYYDSNCYNVTLILEYMDLGSLADYLNFDQDHQNNECKNLQPSKRQKRLSQKALASICYQVLWGLSYLHHERILHRDLKPANVLLNSKGNVKISDLGISGQTRAISGTVTAAGSMDETGSGLNHTVIGTFWYMSPERLFDKTYGLSSDLWSFGLLLLECATAGWNPMRDMEEDDHDESRSKPKPKVGRKKLSSMVELATILETFCIHETIEKIVSKYNQDIDDEGIDWKHEIDQRNSIFEIFIATLQNIPEKRVPAHLLLKSPWLIQNGIKSVDSAVHAMKEYLAKKL